MRLVFRATITEVFERKLRKHQSGHGDNAVFTTDSAGWYIRLGNEITLWCGAERPDYQDDEAVTLTIERSQKDAKA